MHQLLLFPDQPPVAAEPPPLDGDEQAALLDVLGRGGSPQIACRTLGIDVRAYCRSAEEDAGFRRRLRHVRELLTQNVVATVYMAAMKGTPAAQALWLRTFSPPDWTDPIQPSSDSDGSHDFADLSLEELTHIARAFDAGLQTEPQSTVRA